jgi:uncharacterized protein YjbI with pentapeptide repeats
VIRASYYIPYYLKKLSGVDLSGTNLSEVNLSMADLYRANLAG